ncbi:MAG: GNAT family N-acetyltransferase, partial [Bacteroidota bacterium]
MLVRKARLSDFHHLETFVWQAVFPAFDRDGLTTDQRAENDALVEHARTEVMNALDRPQHAVFVALDSKTRSLAGYLIADARPRAYAEIIRIIVKRAAWGKGVADELMAMATDFIGRDRAVSLAVRHYNNRAIAFFAKHDFVDTGEATGSFAIPRSLLLREAYEEVNPPVAETTEAALEDAYYDFPSAADEPIFEALPDYTLSVEDAPLFETGQNALRTDELEEILPEESSLSDEQLNELEAFIARARAKKGVKPPAEPAESGWTIKSGSEVGAATTDSAFTKVNQVDKSSPNPGERKTFDRSTIEFEIDYGAAGTPPAAALEPVATTVNASFEFAFETSSGAEAIPPVLSDEVAQKDLLKSTVEPGNIATGALDLSIATPSVKTELRRSTGKSDERMDCADCGTNLPITARFCYNCGLPQPAVDQQAVELPGEKAPVEDVLLLEDLSEEELNDALITENTVNELAEERPFSSITEGKTDNKNASANSVTLTDLKIAFRHHLQDRLLAYFGKRQLKVYLSCLEASTAFQQVRDGSLRNLTEWINTQSQEKITGQIN